MAKNKKGENIKEKILNCTSELIAQRGVVNTSLSDICKAVEISKGTLYYYYSTKEEIIYDVADRHLSLLTEDILTWLDSAQEKTSPNDILKVVFEKILSAETRGRSHLYLMSDIVSKNEFLQSKFKQKYSDWKTLLEERLSKISPQNPNCKVLAYILLALLDGFTIQRLAGVEDIPLEQIFSFLIKES